MTEPEKEVDKPITMVRYFSISPSNMQTKVITNSKVLCNKINKLDPNNIYRKIHVTTAEYIFFSSVHGRFSKYTICWVIKANSDTFQR